MPMAIESAVLQPADTPRPGITRRQVLRGALAAGATGGGAVAWSSSAQAAPDAGVPAAAALRVLTAWQLGDVAYAGVWSPRTPARGVALPARAHELLPLPAQSGLPGAQALVLARRPGEYLLRMDLTSPRVLRWHTMEDDRYLAGHACASHSGATFFTTETDGETGAGLVVERDWRSLQKIREFASHGVGPHALCTLADGVLLVANGGILNLPESGRRKLNLGRMAPNLCRLDAASGTLLSLHTLNDPFLSLRHLAVLPDGAVAVALQAEHPEMSARRNAPALAVLRDGALSPVPWENDRPPRGWDGYAGDVCCTQGRIWISAPHAGWLASWSLLENAQHMVELPGVGALAIRGQQLVAGGTSAALLLAPAARSAASHRLSSTWDNHAALLSAPG